MSNIKEAVNELEVISQDEIKRMEYNARQKAIWDYNTLMEENFSRGLAEGEARGEIRGIAKGRAEGVAELLAKMKAFGISENDINKILNINS